MLSPLGIAGYNCVWSVRRGQAAGVTYALGRAYHIILKILVAAEHAGTASDGLGEAGANVTHMPSLSPPSRAHPHTHPHIRHSKPHQYDTYDIIAEQSYQWGKIAEIIAPAHHPTPGCASQPSFSSNKSVRDNPWALRLVVSG